MRLFLAVPVPVELSAATAPLLGPDFKPVPPGSWHITMRFLGDQDPRHITSAMDGFAMEPMQAKFTVASAFPSPAKANVAWLGVHAGRALDEAAADILERTRLSVPHDGKPFVAHVTLGRWRRPVDARIMLRHVEVPQETFAIDRVELMASELTPEGPRYERLASWPL